MVKSGKVTAITVACPRIFQVTEYHIEEDKANWPPDAYSVHLPNIH